MPAWAARQLGSVQLCREDELLSPRLHAHSGREASGTNDRGVFHPFHLDVNGYPTGRLRAEVQQRAGACRAEGVEGMRFW